MTFLCESTLSANRHDNNRAVNSSAETYLNQINHIDYPSVKPVILPVYPNIGLNEDSSRPPKMVRDESPPSYINTFPAFTPEQILSMDELTIDCMSYLDINRLYESVLLIHHRGLVDIQKYTEYIKLKQVEQLIINALYKDTENWRIMLSSFDKCHRSNQARLAFLKEQYDKNQY
jgi:hypothetical protein